MARKAWMAGFEACKAAITAGAIPGFMALAADVEMAYAPGKGKGKGKGTLAAGAGLVRL